MAKTSSLVIAVLVGGLLVSGWALFTRPVQVQQNQEPNLEGVATPDFQSNYFSYGGVRHFAGRSDALVAATTTVCAIQAPAATSTLAHASMYLHVSSTTASVVTIANAATQYATTTRLARLAVAANARTVVVATSTSLTDTLLNPGSWIVFGMEGGAGTFSPTGTCQATFVQI